MFRFSRYSWFVATSLTVFAWQASASGVKTLNVAIVDSPAEIVEIKDAKIIEEHIDEASILDNYIVVEFSGTYEAYRNADQVAVRLTRTDDKKPNAELYARYALDLIPYSTAALPITIPSQYVSGHPQQRDFVTSVKVSPSGWDARQIWADWDMFFEYDVTDTVTHREIRGFSARLLAQPGAKPKWIFYKVGF